MDIQVSLSSSNDDPAGGIPRLFLGEANTLSLTLKGQGSLPGPSTAPPSTGDFCLYMTFANVLSLADVQALANAINSAAGGGWAATTPPGMGVTVALSPRQLLTLPCTVPLGSVTTSSGSPTVLHISAAWQGGGVTSSFAPLTASLVNPPAKGNQTLNLGLVFWPGQDVFFTSRNDPLAGIDNTNLFSVVNQSGASVAWDPDHGSLALHLVYAQPATSSASASPAADDGALCLPSDVAASTVQVAPWNTSWNVAMSDVGVPSWNLAPSKRTTLFGPVGSGDATADFQIAGLRTTLPPGTTQAYLVVHLPGYDDACVPVTLFKQVPDPNASGMIWTRLQPPGWVMAGDGVTLTWRAFAAHQVQITSTYRDGTPATPVTVPANVSSYRMNPRSDVSLDVVALNENGAPIGNSWNELLSVGQPTVTSFTASPDTVGSESAVTLSWQAANSDSITLSTAGQPVTLPANVNPAAGTLQVYPTWKVHEYTLVPSINGIQGVAQSLTVTIVPEILNLVVQPDLVAAGTEADVTLTWKLDQGDPGVVTITNSSTSAIIQYTSPATFPIKRSTRFDLLARPVRTPGLPPDLMNSRTGWVHTVLSYPTVSAPGVYSITGLAADKAGNLWFLATQISTIQNGEAVATDPFSGTNYIGYLTPAGQATSQPLASGFRPVGLALGWDGGMWVAEQGQGQPAAGRLTQVTPLLAMTSYPLPPNQIAAPTSLAAGPDGKLWYTTAAGIGWMTTTGTVGSPGPLPATFARGAITAGPDGNMWFTDPGSEAVGKIIPSTGTVTEYPVVPAPEPAITAGPDSNMWFASLGAMSRITPAGAVTRYPTDGLFLDFAQTYAQGADFQAIAAGPAGDGRLWSTVSLPGWSPPNLPGSAATWFAWVTTDGTVAMAHFQMPSPPPDSVVAVRANALTCVCSWNGRAWLGTMSGYVHGIEPV